MRTFRCPACGCKLEMPQEKDFDAIRCAECREVIERSFFDRLDKKREGGLPPRRMPILWRWASKKTIFSRRVEFVETGRIVPMSVKKAFLQPDIVFPLIACLMLIAVGPFVVAHKLGLLRGEPMPWWGVALGLGMCALGCLGLLLFFFLTVFNLERWRRQERLIFGETYLQCILGTDKARLQLPRKLVERISIDTYRFDKGAIRYIGIALKEWRDDVIRDPRLERGGWDVALYDEYELSLDELLARLQNWQRGDDRQSRQQLKKELHSIRRRRLINNVVGLTLLGLILGPCCCLLPVGLVTLMFGPGRNNAGFNRGNDRADDMANLERLAHSIPDQRQEQIARELAERANSPDFFTRQAVIKAIAVWATPKELPVLINALNDDHPAIREAALKGIGRFRDERAVSPVLRCFEDFFTRGPAEKALIEMGPMAEKGVLALLGRQGMNEAVVRVLGQIGTQQSVPALEALRDDFFLGKKAREALAAIAVRSNK